MRTVKIKLTTQSGLISHETEATTWGQLKSELSSQIDFTKEWRVVIRENRHVLEIDDSMLPDGNFILFMYPLRSKAGLTEEEVDGLDYNVARKTATSMGLSAQGTATQIRQRIIDNLPEESSSNRSDLLEQVDEIQEALSVLRDSINNAGLSSVDMEKLQNEFEAVRRTLNL